ncbi:MAG: antibiotic biosynthesis monooxygenase [Desulfobacterales bacterium]|jgi:heme-degrading monooxygenase HmoA
MAVKILIKRSVPASKTRELIPLFQNLRTLAMNQPGYIAGETLKRIDSPGEYLVISTWHSVDDWRQWVLSKERNEIQNRIDMLLQEQTEYEIYEY